MAALTIVRPPLCGDSALEVPRSQWSVLLQERVNFCKNVLPSDCRLLLFFVEDAQKSDWMGFKTREDYLRDGLQLDPEMVGLALRGLTLSDPNKPLGFDPAIVLGKGQGGDHKSEEFRNQTGITRLKRNEHNTRKAILARLDRDRPDLAERVRTGELSANAAAIEAGFRRKLSRKEQILIWLPLLSEEDRQEIYATIEELSQYTF